MRYHPFFRSKKAEKGPGLQFQIRRLTAEEFAREQQEDDEQVGTDIAASTTTASNKASVSDPAAAAAFLREYEKREAVNGLVEALKKARGLS